MSPASDPRYFGKSAFSDLNSVTDAALKVMRGEIQEVEKEVKSEDNTEVTTTEQEKIDG